MLPVLIAMLVALALAAAVFLYVAFPHRGEELPVVPKLGEAMNRAVDSLPTLDEEEQQIAASSSQFPR